jgi:transposase-like protein
MAAKTKTLCAQKDVRKDNLSKYKKLVRDARFICKKCGRAAHDEKSLCKPVTLDS